MRAEKLLGNPSRTGQRDRAMYDGRVPSTMSSGQEDQRSPHTLFFFTQSLASIRH